MVFFVFFFGFESAGAERLADRDRICRRRRLRHRRRWDLEEKRRPDLSFSSFFFFGSADSVKKIFIRNGRLGRRFTFCVVGREGEM